MTPIQWPKSAPKKTLNQVQLPEVTLNDADYKAASEVLLKLDNRMSVVAFLQEVALRHCRERQLEAEILRNRSLSSSAHHASEDLIKHWKKPMPISQFDSAGEAGPTFSRLRRLP